MDAPPLDFAIVGGGLAGGLIARALAKAMPAASLTLLEAGPTLGGNHRWSWFASDLGPDAAALLDGFPVEAIGSGHTVRFPGFTRRLSADYRSLDSRGFDLALRQLLPAGSVLTGAPAAALDAGGVTLTSGERIAARSVIDCRSFEGSSYLEGGWQVFLGQHWRLDAPHGLDAPIIMDADLAQHGAYRFVYVLPLGPREVFIEDTYYADAPILEAESLRARIGDYAAGKGWRGAVVHEETGVLPVITGGNFAALRAETAIAGVALAGARGGFVHPLTSYTVPVALANAVAIAEAASRLSGAALAGFVATRAAAHWRATGFYRMLGKMLFDAGEPAERWRIFARFYRLPEPLIMRFYAARSTPADRLRILAGKPPVPVAGAVRALLGKGAPLVHGDAP